MLCCGVFSVKALSKTHERGANMTDEAFEQAVRDYANTVYRVACHAVKDHSEAEDVTQTVLLRLYQSAPPFEGPEHLKHWLLRVTVNESRKVLRSAWRRRTVSLEDWDGPAPEGEDAGVLEAVMALETKYRLPVYLYYYEGCSVKETARILGSNPSTVQTRLQRARAKLKYTLTEEEEGTGHVRPQIVP